MRSAQSSNGMWVAPLNAAQTRVGTDHMHRRSRVACCQKCLIEHAAGSKAAERVREYGQAGGGHAEGAPAGVLLAMPALKVWAGNAFSSFRC